MQKRLCTTLALGGILLTVAEPVLSQASDKTVTLTNVTTNSCAYESINIDADGNVTVNCKNSSASLPGKPGGVLATPYDGKINVAYTAAASNGSAITKYSARCESADSGAATPLAVDGDGSARSLLVTGATNEKSYTCQVRATNGLGDGDYSDPSSPVTPQAGLDPVPPAQMTKPTVATGSGSITVSFTAPANGGSAITQYEAVCESSNDGASGTATGAATATSISVSNLTGGKTYTCKVRARNTVGFGDYSPPSDSVTLPAGCGAMPAGTTLGTWSAYAAPGIPMQTETISPPGSKAFAFVASKTAYPNGSSILFETTTYAGGSNRADITISTCPGVFDAPQPSCNVKNAKINMIHTAFTLVDTYSCQLIDGQQYYLNVRTASGYPNVAKMVSSQRR